MTGVRVMAVVFAIPGIAVILFGLWQMIRPFRTARRTRSWTPVEAEVIDVRQERRSGPRGAGEMSRTRVVSVITYRYRAPETGEEHTETADLRDREIAEPGRPLVVLVDPRNPSRSQRERSVGVGAYGCGFVAGVFLIVFGAIFVVVGALLWSSA